MRNVVNKPGIKYLTTQGSHKNSNLTFEPSFVGIYQVLREIWPFEHEFQSRNFDQFESIWEYQTCQPTVHKFANFICISTKIKTIYFDKKIDSKISKQSSKNRNKPIIVSFNEFNYQLIVTQAIPLL